MTNLVVRVSIDAQVAGLTLGVQEATLSLGVNSIPTIELMCAPSGERPPPLKPKVIKPTISEYSELYRKLATKSEGLSESGNVTITVEDSEGRKDEINLENWILSGAGMSAVSATSAPYLSVVLQHPVCKLTKVGSVYQTIKSDPTEVLNSNTAGCNNILEIANMVYMCARDLIEYFPSKDGFAEIWRNNLGVGEFEIDRYMKFEGGNGIFLGSNAGAAKEKLAMAIGRMILPMDDGSSTWDMLVHSAGPLMLSITQNEGTNYLSEKGLVIEPAQPWKSQSITLDEKDCFWTELPGIDPFKIAGVMSRKLESANDMVSQGVYENGNENENDPVRDEVMYVPIPEPKLSDGRIMKVSPPPILDSAFRRAESYGDDLPGSKTEFEDLASKSYDEVIKTYCKAVYQTTAASMMRSKAQMALWFRDRNGKLHLPGNTYKFVSQGEDIYYGYAINVVHHMSSAGGCSTTVSMAHVRPMPDFYVSGSVAIPIGSKNPAYDE